MALFQAIRSEAGEEMVLGRNLCVEEVLPTEVLRGLSDEEMAVYRRRTSNPASLVVPP